MNKETMDHRNPKAKTAMNDTECATDEECAEESYQLTEKEATQVQHSSHHAKERAMHGEQFDFSSAEEIVQDTVPPAGAVASGSKSPNTEDAEGGEKSVTNQNSKRSASGAIESIDSNDSGKEMEEDDDKSFAELMTVATPPAHATFSGCSTHSTGMDDGDSKLSAAAGGQLLKVPSGEAVNGDTDRNFTEIVPATTPPSRVANNDPEPIASGGSLLQVSNEEGTNKSSPVDLVGQDHVVAAPANLQNSAEATTHDLIVASACVPTHLSRTAENVVVSPGAVAVAGPGRTCHQRLSIQDGLATDLQEDESTRASLQPTVLEAELVEDDRPDNFYEEFLEMREVVQQMQNAQPAMVHAEVVATEEREPVQVVSDRNDGQALSDSMPDQDDRGNKCNPSKRRRRCFIVFGLIVIAIAVFLGVVLGRNGNSGSGTTQSSTANGPTATSTTNPSETSSSEVPTPASDSMTMSPVTLAPTELISLAPVPTVLPPPTPPPAPLPTLSTVPPVLVSSLKDLIVSVSLDGGASLEDSTSPQYRALSWLAGNANLSNYPDWKKIQRYAMATLYYSTNGTEWRNSSGWLSNDNECEWYANCLSCEPCNDGQNISSVLLNDNGLNGTIPPELALLSNSLAESLNLPYNQIMGAIPTEIGLLSKLNAISLTRNQVAGTIPTEIGMLTKMTSLSLSRNGNTFGGALGGAIPRIFDSMTNLDRLYIHGNDFTGDFECPSFVARCYVSCYEDPPQNVTSPCRSL